jgi:DNA-directed RNA polymerase III subunit RPC1
VPIENVTEVLHPVKVLHLFKNVPIEELEFLGLAERPESLIMTHVPIPPVCIRPPKDSNMESDEDDLTKKLIEIIGVNNSIRQGREKGLPIYNLMENWDLLQLHCATYINSEAIGTLPSMQVCKNLRNPIYRS